MRIILTRSLSENLILEKQIKESIVSSDIDILKLNILSFKDAVFDFSDFSSFDNIIITSKHAAKILSNNIYNQNAYVVGDNSAAILRSKNYNIKYVATNVQEIYDIVMRHQSSNKVEEFIYFSGDNITLEMPPVVRREIIYETEYKKVLDAKDVAYINKGVDIMPVYSTNCAKALIFLLDSENLIKNVANSRIIAISSNIADVLAGSCNNITIADSPVQMTEKILEICQIIKIKK